MVCVMREHVDVRSIDQFYTDAQLVLWHTMQVYIENCRCNPVNIAQAHFTNYCRYTTDINSTSKATVT